MADFRSLLVPKERSCRLCLNEHDGFRKSDPMADFRSLLVPKERSCRLYLNQRDGFRLGIAMGFEKGLHVKPF